MSSSSVTFIRLRTENIYRLSWVPLLLWLQGGLYWNPACLLSKNHLQKLHWCPLHPKKRLPLGFFGSHLDSLWDVQPNRHLRVQKSCLPAIPPRASAVICLNPQIKWIWIFPVLPNNSLRKNQLLRHEWQPHHPAGAPDNPNAFPHQDNIQPTKWHLNRSIIKNGLSTNPRPTKNKPPNQHNKFQR